jgi:predicted RND superfamily exporter protein
MNFEHLTTSLLAFYQRNVLDKPRRAIFLVIVITLGMALGLPNFKLDASADSLTLERDEDLNFFREVSKRYGSDNFLILTFSPKEGDLFDPANLQSLAKLRDELKNIEGVENTVSMLDVPLLYSPKVSVADMGQGLKTLLSDGVDKQLAKQEFLNSPIYKDLLLSADGQTTGMLATLALDQQYLDLVKQRDDLRLLRDTQGLDAQQLLELEQVSETFLAYRTTKAAEDHQRVAQVRSLVENYRQTAIIYLGGPDMITADMITFIKNDLIVFSLGILLFIVITLSVIFRSPSLGRAALSQLRSVPYYYAWSA